MDFYFIFSRGQQKCYCGCYTRVTHTLLPEGIFCFFIFIFFLYSVSKQITVLAVQLEELQVEVEVLGRGGASEKENTKGSVQVTEQENGCFPWEERGN